MAAYGLLTYKAHPQYNVGDYIQSLAAEQFLPQVDQYINREKLSSYSGPLLKMILNGWFMHSPQHWPPSPQIDPLLISFHLNSQVKDQLLSAKGKEWFRKHAPVGCRDLFTLNALQSAGIDAYLSGCLTSTLVNKWNYRTNDIYFVDVLFRVPDWKIIGSSPRNIFRSLLNGDLLRGSERASLLKRLFSEKMLSGAIPLDHYHSSRHTDKERFDMAACFLEKYATAKLVVTSRLHCAIPCLAFGTPVIFVEAGFNKEQDWCRLNGITEYFNTITVEENGDVATNFDWHNEPINSDIDIQNPTTYKKFVPLLQQTCTAFINESVVSV